jgi:hypothetical protein
MLSCQNASEMNKMRSNQWFLYNFFYFEGSIFKKWASITPPHCRNSTPVRLLRSHRKKVVVIIHSSIESTHRFIFIIYMVYNPCCNTIKKLASERMREKEEEEDSQSWFKGLLKSWGRKTLALLEIHFFATKGRKWCIKVNTFGDKIPTFTMQNKMR